VKTNKAAQDLMHLIKECQIYEELKVDTGLKEQQERVDCILRLW